MQAPKPLILYAATKQINTQPNTKQVRQPQNLLVRS